MSLRATIYIRQLRYEEAKNVLLRELDRAFCAGYEEVEIIHGIGTYTLRKMAEQELKKLDYVDPIPAQMNPGSLVVRLLIPNKSELKKYME